MKHSLIVLLIVSGCARPDRLAYRPVHPCDAYQMLAGERGASFNSWYVWQQGQLCAQTAQPPMPPGSLMLSDNPRYRPQVAPLMIEPPQRPASMPEVIPEPMPAFERKSSKEYRT